jgi:hypothetical protein
MAKTEQTMEKVIELKNQIAEKERQIKKGCIDYLKKAIKEAGGTICTDEEEDSLAVTYDGGRHPEYDANPFSVVGAIYLKNGKIYLDTEDCEEYYIGRINDDEVYNVAMFVYEMLNKG